MGKQFLGHATVKIGPELNKNKKSVHLKLPLLDLDKKTTHSKAHGVLHVSIDFPESLLVNKKLMKKFHKHSKFGDELLQKLVQIYRSVSVDGHLTSEEGVTQLWNDPTVFDLMMKSGFFGEPVRKKEEYKAIFADRSMQRTLTASILKTFDQDRDGDITLSEFITVLSVISHGTPAEKAGLAFVMIDLNGDGYLDRTEVVKLQSATLDAFVTAMRAGLAGGKNEPLSAENRKILSLFTELFKSKEFLEYCVDELYKSAGVDPTGKISKKEYVAWFIDTKKRAVLTERINNHMKEYMDEHHWEREIPKFLQFLKVRKAPMVQF